MLQAGYLEDWVWNATLSGASARRRDFTNPLQYLPGPAGHVRRDSSHTAAHPGREQETQSCIRQGENGCRARPPTRRPRRSTRDAQAAAQPAQRGSPGSGLPAAPLLPVRRRHLLGFTGPEAEAEQIRQRLAQFLREDLKLELNPDKTLITHARTQAAAFLGYEITVQHSATRPAVNGSIALRVPKAVIKAKCAPYLKRGKPARRTELMNQDDHVIISTYGAEYRGLVQYYLLAGDVWRLNGCNGSR